jgi:hypothetical protein
MGQKRQNDDLSGRGTHLVTLKKIKYPGPAAMPAGGVQGPLL